MIEVNDACLLPYMAFLLLRLQTIGWSTANLVKVVDVLLRVDEYE